MFMFQQNQISKVEVKLIWVLLSWNELIRAQSSGMELVLIEMSLQPATHQLLKLIKQDKR